MINLKHRQMGQEITDDLTLSDPEVIENLKEIENLNRFFGGHSISLDGVKRLLPVEMNQQITIADFGCGGGDTIAHFKKNLIANEHIRYTGIDGNYNTAQYAASKFLNDIDVDIFHANIFSEEVKNKIFDIIHISQTCHHFSDKKLVALIKQLYGQCRIGFVINDVHRHIIPLWGLKVLYGTFLKTGIGRHDGPQSIRRGFRRKDFIRLFKAAGIEKYRIRWCWAFHWLVTVKK